MFAAVLLHIDSFGKTVILHFQNVHLLAHKNNKIKIISAAKGVFVGENLFAAVLLHIDSFGKTVILHFQNVHLLAHKNNKIKIICCIYKQNRI